jgi:hypothetical protein
VSGNQLLAVMAASDTERLKLCLVAVVLKHGEILSPGRRALQIDTQLSRKVGDHDPAWSFGDFNRPSGGILNRRGTVSTTVHQWEMEFLSVRTGQVRIAPA